jgi:hypothetical protein
VRSQNRQAQTNRDHATNYVKSIHNRIIDKYRTDESVGLKAALRSARLVSFGRAESKCPPVKHKPLLTKKTKPTIKPSQAIAKRHQKASYDAGIRGVQPDDSGFMAAYEAPLLGQN